MDSTRTVKDLYGLLGVSPTATPSQIKAAWRSTARTAHPDRGGNDEDFHQLRLAYETLSDPLARASYDARLASERASRDEERSRSERNSRLREESWARERAKREHPERGRSYVPHAESPTFEQRVRRARSTWWRTAPRFIRLNARGAVIILAVSWAAWVFSRAGVLHVRNLAQVFGLRAAPSLSDVAIVASLAGALGLSSLARLVTQHLGVAKDFATWVSAGALGLYIEPLAWVGAVQVGLVAGAVAWTAWFVFSRLAPSKVKVLAVWRAKKHRS